MNFPTGHRVMVTGHRTIRGEQARMVRVGLSTLLERIQARQPSGLVAISGMAVGTDMEFAEAAVYLGIPLVAAIPCETQSSLWPKAVRDRYDRLIDSASHVVAVWKNPSYHAATIGAKLFARNRWMLDHSDSILGVWDGRMKGGTYHTIQEALRRERKVLIIDPSTGVFRVEAPAKPELEGGVFDLFEKS